MTAQPRHLLIQGDAGRIPLPDKSVSLVLGSPPYTFARTYGIGAQRDCREWVRWMLGITAEAVRVSRGLVLWVVAGQTRDHCYEPSPEGLLWEWWSRGVGSGTYIDGIELPRVSIAECCCWRPAYWRRVGIPGSGGPKWLRADVEYVLAFKGPDNDFWTDNLACGKPNKFRQGGPYTHRTIDGKRVVTMVGSKRPSGKRKDWCEATCRPEIANPGNLVHTSGGHLGSDHAHLNEAPFPEDLAEFFVRSFCPPGGIVLDPFSGSGTTVAVAEKFGRIGIGGDLRLNQCKLASRRIERPHARVARPARAVAPMPLLDGLDDDP